MLDESRSYLQDDHQEIYSCIFPHWLLHLLLLMTKYIFTSWTRSRWRATNFLNLL